jgi:hypothetical protein
MENGKGKARRDEETGLGRAAEPGGHSKDGTARAVGLSGRVHPHGAVLVEG